MMRLRPATMAWYALVAHLDPAFAEKLLNFIIAEVIRHHETIASEAVASDGTEAR